ncbi:MAG: ROK family protein [Chitinophagaceae bacterium]
MLYQFDSRVVLILDAGGTNFVFSAMKGGHVVTESLTLPAFADNLDKCLGSLEQGFRTVAQRLEEPPVAISFAFPGPADYPAGIISGDLPNFPAFAGMDGFPLKAYLEEIFQVPVFINNDGDLYAFGEAYFGFLPQVNARLKETGSNRQYKNLIGLTFGTGFGAGIVIDGKLLIGDNSCGAEVFPLRNRELPSCFVEETVSIRGLVRMYGEESGTNDRDMTPEMICRIAEGTKDGNQRAALRTFERFGYVVSDAIADLITLLDGLVVIGGGIVGASRFFLPTILNELNKTINKVDGTPIARIPQKVYDLESVGGFQSFAKNEGVELKLNNKSIWYDKNRKSGIGISAIGASIAIMRGAYSYALSELDK